MTMCPPDCAKCVGAECAACVLDDPSLPVGRDCTHDSIERHRGMSELLLASRVPTRPLPPVVLDGEIEITVEDGEGLLAFLEALTRAVRARGKIKLKIS